VIGTVVNVVWVAYDFVCMSVLVTAVRFQGYQEAPEETTAAGDR
jgi:cellulose synthase (UDP-forming)